MLIGLFLLLTHKINFLKESIGGSVVECSPATRAARVRFPADATFLQNFSIVGVGSATTGQFWTGRSATHDRNITRRGGGLSSPPDANTNF